MSGRQELHELIDQLPDSEIPKVRTVLEEACAAGQAPAGQPEPIPTDIEDLHRMAEELFRDVPQEEWDRLPDDLIDNLDHYLYGTPKR